MLRSIRTRVSCFEKSMAVAGLIPARRDREEVSTKDMRKFLALAMIAALAATIALAVVGCGKKAEESSEATPPPASSMSSDSGMSGMQSDSAMKAMQADSAAKAMKK
jgi:hypothetical protein